MNFLSQIFTQSHGINLFDGNMRQYMEYVKINITVF